MFKLFVFFAALLAFALAAPKAAPQFLYGGYTGLGYGYGGYAAPVAYGAYGHYGGLYY
ncbi:cuticle protein 6.4-like [Tribolium madens]|uniref:cuticle protein 6.4-like n=1 Tax=Tribolium madens TaxID=41895 RepID=UPI001CF71EAE|nr:cuticle protein 6.4-like [Tribolium madens]